MSSFDEWIKELREVAEKIIESQPDSFRQSNFSYNDGMMKAYSAGQENASLND